jgi:hypothetical protein
VATNYLLEGNDKYIRKYPEEDLVRILKDSSYHSEEWEETDSEEDSDKENGETITEKSAVKTSIHIYEIWWRSPAVCIIIIYIFFGLLFIVLLRNCLIYLLKLQRLLHDRIDPTVNLLRKKEDQMRKKRVQRCKSVTNLPPKGVPSWCLNRQALEKLNRSTNNIPVYDYSDTDEEHDSSHDTDNEVRNRINSNKQKRKNKKKSKHEKKHKKRSKKN